MARDSVRDSEKSEEMKSMEPLSEKQSIKRKRDDLKDKEQKHTKTAKNEDFSVERLSHEIITEVLVIIREILVITDNKSTIISPVSLNSNVPATDLSKSHSKLIHIYSNEDLRIQEGGSSFNDNPTRNKIENDSSSNDNGKSDEPKKKNKLVAIECWQSYKKQEIHEKEEARAKNALPKSVAKFDRLVSTNPNNLCIWLQYANFHLAQREVRQARAVFRRAINTIYFIEDRQKIKLFKAWLQMELENGTEQTVQNVFRKALSKIEPEHIYPEMMILYAEKDKYENLEQIIKEILYQLNEKSAIWMACCKAYLGLQEYDKTRLLIDRAIKSLQSNNRICILMKSTPVANRIIDREQIFKLYDKILIEHPQNVDILTVFVNRLIKNGQINFARRVLQHYASQNLSPLKMKVIFKKFISLEKQHGTHESVKNVRQMYTNLYNDVNS